MNLIRLMAVLFAARDMLQKLKSGQQLGQEMIERLDRAVTECKMGAEDNA